MSQREIVEHAGYLNDRTKLAAYQAALAETVGPRTTVLDLGAGTGILGLLAARAGARRVYSVDQGSIIAAAEAIAEANGLADRMVFVEESSRRLQLPEPIDLVVGDQIGGLAYDAGVLVHYADARNRLLAPGGTLLPSGFELLAAPVDADFWADSVGLWADAPAGFDMGPMHELAANTEFRTDVPLEQFLGPAVSWADIAADHVTPVKGSAELPIARSGALNGVLGMFTAQLSRSVRLTNHPGRPETFRRWQNFYPLPEPVNVVPDDVVTVTFDIRPVTDVATWTVEVIHADGRRLRHRGSTVLGMFLTSRDVAASASTNRPRPGAGLAADRDTLALVDGERSVAQIVDEVWDRHRSAFRSHADAEKRVRDLLWRHLEGEASWSDSPTA